MLHVPWYASCSPPENASFSFFPLRRVGTIIYPHPPLLILHKKTSQCCGKCRFCLGCVYIFPNALTNPALCGIMCTTDKEHKVFSFFILSFKSRCVLPRAPGTSFFRRIFLFHGYVLSPVLIKLSEDICLLRTVNLFS